jgi:hypothetical protein
VIDAASLSLDEAATEELRSRMRGAGEQGGETG